MHRPHRTTADRLAALPAEERDRLAALPVQDLADMAESRRYALDQLAERIGREWSQVAGIEVILADALRRSEQGSIVAARPDGTQVVWTPHKDGTGFHRVRLNRPRAVGEG